MTSLGLGELLVIGIVLLLFVGPERLPYVTRNLGRAYATVRRSAEELRRALVLEADRLDEEDRLKTLRERRNRIEQEARAQHVDGTVPQSPRLVEPPADDAMEVIEVEVVPEGFTPDEWADVPEHVRELVRRRGSR